MTTLHTLALIGMIYSVVLVAAIVVAAFTPLPRVAPREARSVIVPDCAAGDLA